MECGGQLDLARCSATGGPLKRALGWLIVLSGCPLGLPAQPPPGIASPLERLKQLSVLEQWQEVVRLAQTFSVSSPDSAELDYYYGMALARLGRWDEAAKTFQAGIRLNPNDKRLPLELAGVAFKEKHYTRAVSSLQRALRLDPEDAYTNEFLATVYFLEDNLEASLKYWNRVAKPRLENVQAEPEPRVDPVLLDRAFAFSPASTLRLPDLLTSERRIAGLGIFANYRFDLAAREDGKFDLQFRAQERSGWGNSTLEGMVRLLRGLPFQTIHPEFFNLHREAVNLQSLIRWDTEKRRFEASLSGPLDRRPTRRYAFGTDLRNENWDIRNSFTGLSPLLGALNLRREAFEAEITSFLSGGWTWSAGAEISHRDFRAVSPGTFLLPGLLAQGFQLKQQSQLSYQWRIPEKRFTLRTGANSQLGRLWSDPAQLFEKLQASLVAHWFPESRGEDYETYAQIRGGKTFGRLPFDELFMLGAERDNALWLRGHIGTRDGRKGSAPMGRNYLLGNWETDKIAYENGFVTFKAGPFLDTGKITDPSSILGSKKWLCDTGIQVRVRVLGVEVGVSYGRDLRSGNNAFYSTVGTTDSRPQ
jgi:tetratricopeptide (TPR) repeat protein